MKPRIDTTYPILDAIKNRWSPRAFSERPVRREDALTLFEAARWSASCFNEQPWRFVFAHREDTAAFTRLAECLVGANRGWASRAAVLIATVAKTHFDHNGKPNRHAFHDVGLACGSLVVQAASMDLYMHMMAGFDIEKSRRSLHIPEGYEPVAFAALGYVGDPNNLTKSQRQRELAPQTRLELRDIAFSGVWNAAAENQ